MILCDTGFWFALANPKDKYYSKAIEVAQSLNEDPITTWPVVTETCHLLANRISTKACIAFISSLIKESIQIVELKYDDLPKIKILMEKYADLPMDLADASLVILAEQLGHGRIFSTDQRDFMAYRWKKHYPFENLLVS